MTHFVPRVIPAACALLLLPAISQAQCVYQTSLLATFDAAGNPVQGQAQYADSGWTFRRSDSGALLTGVTTTSWSAGGWGTPDQPFFIPIVGPRYSSLPGRNQNVLYRRAPSFEGLFFHPGYTPIDVHARVQPQATGVLRSLTLHIEHLGTASPNALVSARVETASGPVMLIPPTSVLSLAPALTLSATAGTLPRAFGPSDRLVIVGNNGGGPEEDWVNLDATVELEGPPLIATQPADAQACSGADVTLKVVAAGATGYQWRRGGAELTGKTSSTLLLPNVRQSDQGAYDCIVSNLCGSVTSRTLTVSICAADLNCDGLVDFGDYLEFLNRYDAGDLSADFNEDGLVDFSDYLEFLNLYDAGC